MTRDALTKLEFDEKNRIFVGQEYPCAFDEIGIPIPTTIGRTWETKRTLKIGGMIQVLENEYTEPELLVVGRPRGYDYQVCEHFKYSAEGFEAAKRFMLTGKK